MAETPDNVLRINHGLVIPLAELEFRFSRSGGPGGQNVNKVESKVELLFDLEHSPSLSDFQRQAIRTELARFVDQQGILHLVAQESRSQHQNRAQVTVRFIGLVQAALVPKRKRHATRPTRGSKRAVDSKGKRTAARSNNTAGGRNRIEGELG